MEVHNIDPVYNKDSRILILGSFPSVRSREAMFFYHHRQNRFWKIMESLFDVELGTIERRKEFLLDKHIALWDVVASCDIALSSDQSICNVIPNDLSTILSNSHVEAVFTNGGKAYELYMRYQYDRTGILPYRLPSTSSANASFSLECLIEKWSMILEYL